MKTFSSLSALLAVAVGLSASADASPLGMLLKRDINDPFFTAPVHVQGNSHGKVLRSRAVDVSGLNITVPIQGAYQILYSSSDPINNVPFATPATIIVPQGNVAAYTKPKGNQKRVNRISSHQLPYDAAYKGCGPSYQLANNSRADPSGGDLPFIEGLLSQNITVVLPDYEGPMGAFDVGPVEGNGVLDAVLAVLDFKPVVPYKNEAAVVLDGYSGGAIATGWALQQQAKYAPELKPYLKGGVMGGLPSNATADFLLLDGAPASGLVLSAISAQMNVFTSFRNFINQHLNALGKKAIAAAEMACLSADEAAAPYTHFYPTFTDLTTDQALASPAAANMLNQLVLAKKGAGIPQAPVLMYSSVVDEIVPHQDSVRYFESVCSQGAKSVQFIDVQGTTHVETYVDTFPTKAIPYIVSRFAGVPAVPGCTTSSYTPPAPVAPSSP